MAPTRAAFLALVFQMGLALPTGQCNGVACKNAQGTLMMQQQQQRRTAKVSEDDSEASRQDPGMMSSDTPSARMMRPERTMSSDEGMMSPDSSATEGMMSSDGGMMSSDTSAEEVASSHTSATITLDWRRIICPIMGAFFRAGDLIPTETGMITQATTRTSLERLGFEASLVALITDSAFDHIPDKMFNLTNMDLQMRSARPQEYRNKEHDFSTGIRDGAAPNATAYRVFEQFIATDGDDSRWSQTDIQAAIKYYHHNSNDLGEGAGGIFSLGMLVSAFGDSDGTLSKKEMRNLFMKSKYPKQYKTRRDAAVAAWGAAQWR